MLLSYAKAKAQVRNNQGSSVTTSYSFRPKGKITIITIIIVRIVEYNSTVLFVYGENLSRTPKIFKNIFLKNSYSRLTKYILYGTLDGNRLFLWLSLSNLTTFFTLWLLLRPIGTHMPPMACNMTENWPNTVHFSGRIRFWDDWLCILTT